MTVSQPPAVRRTGAPDKASDVLRASRHPLDPLFRPQSVAVIGATEKAGSVGRTVLWNLISSPFGGTVLSGQSEAAQHPGHQGLPEPRGDVPSRSTWRSSSRPRRRVPGLVRRVRRGGRQGRRSSSRRASRRSARPGRRWKRQSWSEAREAGIRIIGPNCLGVMSPVGGLNATFAAGMARAGHASASSARAARSARPSWTGALREGVGFSAFVSLGSMLDVGWGDLIDYLGDDPHTKSIVIYMESIGDARAFLSAAREVALTKPIIVIKAGRTRPAAKAAASHTGSLTGSDDVLDAAFRRVGVLRVDTSPTCSTWPRCWPSSRGRRVRSLTIVTNAGGPGVLATDALIAERRPAGRRSRRRRWPR